ncbi:peptide-N-glycosidase F-related protein [Flavobacterium subsaxonicum]|uniref:Peptide-N-glycosidase F N-terminal domain-containing protein n=1 Tax=Flavobacterium subsaxonicum WB 4.1-42 = DSM 21790 TaxID=1121898 RepID=A0A0A2ML99_9FLAO|nr:peptide-N-glycosidase F-related protein [Flavobacterium subsaxonicum]KGO93437.1 hypothetical protein Q766_09085 [Flavobacterium subsaxonicum WB 4.1-42 = DSM 21790]
MKKTLLLFSLCASMFSYKAAAQEPYTLNLFNQAVYYGMYEGTVDEPLPEGAIRHSNSSYGKKLTAEQIASFGNTLTMTVTLNPLCDNYDRIGKVNLVLVPAGATSYAYNDTNITRMEIGRFITPFMDMNVTDPNAVPYVYNVDNLTQIFHDATINTEYDFWVELEVYGYQGGPGQGGAAVEIPGCAGRNDVYMGSLDFTSTTNPDLVLGENHFVPLISNYELKKYAYPTNTDVEGETTKTVTFTLDEAVPNAKFYLITSNHGSNSGGEEYVRRWHYVYLDGVQVSSYRPGGVSCVPYSVYNTQPNCIYLLCNGTSAPRPDTNSAWSWNNWCPGDKIPIREIALGDLEAGEHSFKIDVPAATFTDDQGYFPMSVYFQGYTEVNLSTKQLDVVNFSIAPNPVTDVATITTTAGQEVKSVAVINTLGQTVWTGTSDKVDLSSLQSGIYVVNVAFTNNQTATKKVVKN